MIIDSLNALLRDYSASATRSAAQLVEIDKAIRKLKVIDLPEWFYDKSWEPLGLHEAHYGGVEYDNKFILEAHELDPNAFRCYTLYSETFEPDSDKLLEAYLKYLDECPRGPFAFDALKFLGDTYYDVFSAAMRLAKQDRVDDYHLGCSMVFLKETEPYEPQAERARLKAIELYERADKLQRNHQGVQHNLERVRARKLSDLSRCWD